MSKEYTADKVRASIREIEAEIKKVPKEARGTLRAMKRSLTKLLKRMTK